jgi:hypothetical protein
LKYLVRALRIRNKIRKKESRNEKVEKYEYKPASREKKEINIDEKM